MGKRNSRSDVDSDAIDGLQRKNERVVAACQRCRKRKQKCDGEYPACGSCKAAGVTCVPSDRLAIHTNTTCECASLRQRVAELEVQLATTSDNARAHDHETVEDAQQPSANLTILSTPPPQIPVDQPVSEPHNGDFWHNRLLRPTFLLGTTQHRIIPEALGSAWDLWGNDDSTATPSRLHESLEHLHRSQHADELVEVFFSENWPQLPILHRSSFMEARYQLVLNSTTVDGISKFQVYMVLAIAACGRTSASSSYHVSHQDLFQQAAACMSSVSTASDVEFLQCLLLLCMYGRKEPQSVDIWHTTGLALRTAIGIDMHKKEYYAGKDRLDSEMAKRLFWSAYAMDRLMAVTMSRPLGLDDSAITCPLPLQLTDEQLLLPDPGTNLGIIIPGVQDTSTFVHVIKIRQINAKIYTKLYSAGADSQDQDLEGLRIAYHNELNTWLITAPRYLRVSSMYQSPEWFEIAYHHAVLALFRPSHAFPFPTIEALQFCAESSISLITRYAALYARNKVSYSFIALNSVFMAAMTMLYALRASPLVRQQLSEAVAKSNIQTCIQLCEGISEGRKIAEKCSNIIQRLGEATLASFHRPSDLDTSIDKEFLAWFGLKSDPFAFHQHTTSDVIISHGLEQVQDVVPVAYDPPSIDMAWRDIFPDGMTFDDIGVIDFSV